MAVQNDKVNGEKNRAAARSQILSKVNGKIRGNEILNPLRFLDGLPKKSVVKLLESATVILKKRLSLTRKLKVVRDYAPPTHSPSLLKLHPQALYTWSFGRVCIFSFQRMCWVVSINWHAVYMVYRGCLLHYNGS